MHNLKMKDNIIGKVNNGNDNPNVITRIFPTCMAYMPDS